MKHLFIYTLVASALCLSSCNSKTTKTETKETAKEVKVESIETKKDCGACPSASSCSAAKPAASETSSCCASKKKEAIAGVYYFHGDRRCKTCKAVGSIAEEMAEANADYKFYDVNIDQAENKEIAKEFEATGSSLIIKTNSGKIINLTDFAFMNANSKPEELKTKIEESLKL